MRPARIMLVESTRAKRASFAEALCKRYNVVSAPSGKQALILAKDTIPDAVVLDAISMRTPGDRICQQLRRAMPDVPIIHLHPGPRPEGGSGADRLLFLPFTSRKLINGIEGLLQKPDDTTVVCGPFAVHVGRRTLLAHGQESHLTPKLALLFELFLRHAGETLDRRTLMEQVWHTDYLGDTRTLDVHIRWIRRAIETDPGHPQYLKTVRGVGYRLEVPDVNGSVPAIEPVLAMS